MACMGNVGKITPQQYSLLQYLTLTHRVTNIPRTNFGEEVVSYEDARLMMGFIFLSYHRQTIYAPGCSQNFNTSGSGLLQLKPSI
ncbi:protein HEADING DATE 3A-like [Glycine soja]|uniref:protein HEADING DATE 3A-like n=1 Tax=Glycine soja TaxID=3848 RepID=UPI00103DAF74|nr:protein HEADING DATE 3A-like [Glycine soja]